MNEGKITANVRQAVADIVTLAVAMQDTPKCEGSDKTSRAVNVDFNAALGLLTVAFYFCDGVDTRDYIYKYNHLYVDEGNGKAEESILRQLNELHGLIKDYLR